HGTGRYGDRHRPGRRHAGTGQHGRDRVRRDALAYDGFAVAEPVRAEPVAFAYSLGAARYRLGIGPTWPGWSPSSWTKIERRSTASPRWFSSYPSSHAHPL